MDASFTRCLILACGNTLRCDDGIGPVLCAWAETRFAADSQVRAIARQQWTPDLAEDIAAAESVIFVMVGVFCAVAARQIARRRHLDNVRLLVRALFASLAGLAANQLFAFFFFRPRPFVSYPDVANLIAMTPLQKSFPSGHATVAFAVAFSSVHDRRLFYPLLALAVVVSFGRMAVGVHYPTDILGGLFAGLFWSGVAAYLDGLPTARRLWRRLAAALRLQL